jgi:hypothetical protein
MGNSSLIVFQMIESSIRWYACLRRLPIPRKPSQSTSPLAGFLTAYEITLADEMGWAKFQNGQLLRAAEREGFDVLLSGDQTIKYEQSMAGRTIAVASMSDNHRRIVKDYVAAIVETVCHRSKPTHYQSTHYPVRVEALIIVPAMDRRSRLQLTERRGCCGSRG